MMRILTSTLAILALAAAACGGTLKTTGTSDGVIEDTHEDTAGDVEYDVDAPTDLPVEVEPDTEPDVEPDTVPDVPPDTAIDTPIDTAPDTPIDTALDTTIDTTPDTSIDTSIDTGVDTRPDVIEVVEIIEVVDLIEIEVSPDVVGCIPGTTRCSGGNLEVCRLDGSGYDSTPCPYGCLTTPAPAHCGVWEPSNIGMAIVDDGTQPFGPTNPEWTTGTTYVEIDADTGEIVGMTGTGSTTYTLRPAGTGLDSGSGIAFDTVAQPSGAPTIGVFSVTSVDIPTGTTVWVTGSNAFALASEGTVAIAGTLNCKGYFSGTSMTMYPGPGGAGASAGPGAGGDGVEGGMDDGGGGGAGYGGAGGSSGPTGMGGTPGTTYGGVTLVPIWGGSGGGNGADNPGYGGPGGGACEIVSLASISITGLVDAAGHGGEGGSAAYGIGGGGGGGGSGGGLLLEAPAVTVSGHVVANGGGGGSGAMTTSRAGEDGDRGNPNLTAALGGLSTGTGEVGCDGGNGNSSTAVAGGNCVCETGDDDGGGGGGGAGRIRVNGMTRTLSITLSPAISTGVASEGPLPAT